MKADVLSLILFLGANLIQPGHSQCLDPPAAQCNSVLDDPGGRNFRDTVTYTCDQGYFYFDNNGRMQTEESLRCNRNDQWRPASGAPNCMPVTCGMPPQGSGTVQVPENCSLQLGESFTYACLAGHETNETLTIECTPHSNWSAPAPNCQPVHCPQPAAGVGTKPVTVSSLTYLQSYTYECLDNYFTEDPLTTVCQSNRDLSLSVGPTCTQVICGVPPEGTMTKPVDSGSLSYPESYTYTCMEGYSTNNDSLCIVCLRDGMFSMDNAPNCTEIMCGTPGNGYNTVAVPPSTNLNYLGTYTYECEKGFVTSDELCTVCLPDGSFSNPPPRCQMVSCGELANGTNTVPVPFNNTLYYEDFYIYECIPGYITNDSIVTICLETGVLSLPQPPTCHRLACPLLINGANTEPVPTNIFRFGDSYTYNCIEGYVTPEPRTAVCEADGFWSIPPPYCRKCSPPPDGIHTVPVPTDFTGRNYTYECEQGFVPPFTSMMTYCNDEGVWSLNPPPTCTLRCNGTVANCERGIRPGTNCMEFYVLYHMVEHPFFYTCGSGYIFSIDTCSCELKEETCCPVP